MYELVAVGQSRAMGSVGHCGIKSFVGRSLRIVCMYNTYIHMLVCYCKVGLLMYV